MERYISATVMRESPDDAVKRFEYKSVLTDKDICTLKLKGVVVVDNVLSEEQLHSVREEINVILNRKRTFIANGFQINDQEDLTIRSDLVLWICETVSDEHRTNILGEALTRTLRQIRSIPHDLQSHGLDFDNKIMGVPFSNQLACYDGNGSNYVAHRDAPEIELSETFTHPLSWYLLGPIHERELTIVIYLNESTWNSKHEGSTSSGNLRCYVDAESSDMTGETAKSVINIEPIGGRMVIFDSRKILHEVMPSYERRLALTCWVGGKHSKHSWLRMFCIPYNELNWSYIYIKYCLRKPLSTKSESSNVE